MHYAAANHLSQSCLIGWGCQVLLSQPLSTVVRRSQNTILNIKHSYKTFFIITCVRIFDGRYALIMGKMDARVFDVVSHNIIQLCLMERRG